MQKWEYARLIFDDSKLLYGWIVYLRNSREEGRFPSAPHSTMPVNALITKLGLEGWEMTVAEAPTQAIYRSYFFKRPIE